MKIFGYYRDNVKDVDADTTVQTEKITDEDIIRFTTAGVLRLTIDATGIKITSLTTGSVLFAGAGGLISQDNANFFWDNTNKRLGLGTATLAEKLEVYPNTDVSAIIGRAKVGDIVGTADIAGFSHIDDDNTTDYALIQTSAGTTILNCKTGQGVYIRINNQTTNQVFFNGTSLTYGANTDSVHFAVGRAKIGQVVASDYGGFAHFDHFDATGYALLQGPAGQTFLNSKGGQALSLRINNADALVIDADKEVGVGVTPTLQFDVKAKSGMSAIGGICIKLTNKTGANSVAGQIVSPDTATDDGVILNAISGVNPIGVFLESGVTDGSEAWVVVSGIADVALDDNVAAVHGNWMGSGVAAGYAATQASPPVAPIHFQEIGHCIESVAAGGGGTHILARCVLHFN